MQRLLDKGVTPKMLMAIDESGSGEVAREEFLAFMLIKLNKV